MDQQKDGGVKFNATVTQTKVGSPSYTHTPMASSSPHSPTTHSVILLYTYLCHDDAQLGDDPAHTVGRILYEYKIHNCEILLREDVSTVSKQEKWFGLCIGPEVSQSVGRVRGAVGMMYVLRANVMDMCMYVYLPTYLPTYI